MSGKYLERTEGAVYLDEDGKPAVIPKVQEQLERHKQRREDCIQYAAIATEDGYRCLSPNTRSPLHRLLQHLPYVFIRNHIPLTLFAG